MKRVYAMRRKGTAKMRYEPASSEREAEYIAKLKEVEETGMPGEWQIFKTSFTINHWAKEADLYMGIYKATAKKMFEEEIA